MSSFTMRMTTLIMKDVIDAMNFINTIEASCRTNAFRGSSDPQPPSAPPAGALPRRTARRSVGVAHALELLRRGISIKRDV
jgi:hypothetical protein